MPEIAYQPRTDYAAALRSLNLPHPPPAVLVFGEQSLTRSEYGRLLHHFLPDAERSLNYDAVDDAQVPVEEIIARLNTYSLVPGVKVVGLMDAVIFRSQDMNAAVLEKIRRSWEAGDRKAAASALARLLTRLDLSLEHLDPENALTRIDPEASAKTPQWLKDVIAWGREQGITAGRQSGASPQAALADAIRQGFAPGTLLMIATDTVDRRSALYRQIREKGLIVDCSLPTGSGKSAQHARRGFLLDRIRDAAEEAGTSLEKGAAEKILELTGDDLSLIVQNVRKLASYRGASSRIRPADVDALLERTRTDPLYEFTGALGERRAEKALHHLDELLNSDMVGLQLLAAITNQLRRLLAARGCIDSCLQQAWRPRMTYPQFRENLLPRVAEYDQELRQWMENREARLLAEQDGQAPARRKALDSKLFLSASGSGAYAVYNLFLRADRFSRGELEAALQMCLEFDRSVKAGSASMRPGLERLVLTICRSQDPSQKDGGRAVRSPEG